MGWPCLVPTIKFSKSSLVSKNLPVAIWNSVSLDKKLPESICWLLALIIWATAKRSIPDSAILSLSITMRSWRLRPPIFLVMETPFTFSISLINSPEISRSWKSLYSSLQRVNANMGTSSMARVFTKGMVTPAGIWSMCLLISSYKRTKERSISSPT